MKVNPPSILNAKLGMLRDLARAQAEAGFGGEARRWIDRQESVEERIMSLIGLAQGLAAKTAKQ